MRLLFIFLLVWALAGCVEDVPPPAGIEYSFSVVDKFGQESEHFIVGEKVTLKLVAENTGDQSELLFFASAQIYDFEVLDKEGNQVWLWSSEQVFAQAIRELELQPQTQNHYSVEWSLSKLNDALEAEPLPIGEYEFRGYIVGYEAPASVRVFIQ